MDVIKMRYIDNVVKGIGLDVINIIIILII